MTIILKKISILDEQMPECIALSVLPEQRNFVASNAKSLAEAYDQNKIYEEDGKGFIVVPYAVYEGDTMVGFAMYGYCPPDAEDSDEQFNTTEHYYYFWRLLIDKHHQGRGIGREVVRQVMAEIKTQPCGAANFCYVSYEPSNIGSKTTFASYGFKEDGRIVDGETVAVFRL
ncbi:MAG: GNAT family N-acetyltransferase [Defluviitaleaceae bacterium]|nr:GNAT family N-acetyltransferase [Defluviitaleaceae bacterium]